MHSPPFSFSQICITIKKRLADCSLVTSRLQVLLDDILWVLTDSQIKAVVLHMRSLNPVIQKAAAQSKVHAEAAGEVSAAIVPVITFCVSCSVPYVLFLVGCCLQSHMWRFLLAVNCIEGLILLLLHILNSLPRARH